MSKQSEAQRLATVRKLTAELYSLQDRMNQTIDQITLLLHGSEVGEALAPISAALGADGGIERTLSPAVMALPMDTVFISSPASGHALGEQCRFYSDYKSGQLQLVQVPAARGSDARFALNVNFANFDGSWMSLVFDGRPLLAGLPAGRARFTLSLELRGDPQVKFSVKLGFRIGGQAGEAPLNPRGGRVMVDAFEVPMLDPSMVDALDLHVIFTPQARGSIELQRLSLAVTVWPTVPAEQIANVFEGAA